MTPWKKLNITVTLWPCNTIYSWKVSSVHWEIWRITLENMTASYPPAH